MKNTTSESGHFEITNFINGIFAPFSQDDLHAATLTYIFLTGVWTEHILKHRHFTGVL